MKGQRLREWHRKSNPYKVVLSPHSRHEVTAEIVGNHLEISGGYGQNIEEMVYLDASQAMKLLDFLFVMRESLDDTTGFH